MTRPDPSADPVPPRTRGTLLLGRGDRAWVWATRDSKTGRPALTWQHRHDEERAAALEPILRSVEAWLQRIRSALTGKREEFACHLLGTCLFQSLESGDPTQSELHFKPLEDFLASHRVATEKNRKTALPRPSRPSWLSRLSRWAQAALILTVLLAVCVAGAWVDARRGASQAAEMVTIHEGGPGTEELVVLVHGFTGNREKMDDVLQAIHEQRPAADLLLFSYQSSLFSNADPFALASELEAAIADRDRTRKYKRIFLSGYSMGALLVRKAYVYGCGGVEDLNFAGDAVTTRPPKNWVKKVDRIVLLAGMNRGWNPEGRLHDTDRFISGLRRVGLALARLSGTGHFVRSFARGEPFVANLRLQWLSTMAKARAGEGGLRAPVVVQLLGDQDNVVSQDDSRDVRVAQEYLWVAVNNTGHANLLSLGRSGDGLERKRRIQGAFGTDRHIEELRRATPLAATETDPKVTTVIFVLHGIRDMGVWTSEFMKPLEEGFAALNPGSEEKVYVHRAAYDYFPMGSFLLLGDRQKNVRWFMDQVAELRARFPNLKELHFIGHSNGTEVLASALATYQTLKVGRVVFAGSVVRRDFEWSSFIGRVGQVRNYVASADWVVALFPKLFELPGFRFLNPDLGSAGYNGFEDGFVKNLETQFIVGGHKAALDPRNVRSIVAFILKGERVDVDELLVSRHPALLDFASHLCWAVWLALFGTVGWIGYKLPSWLASGWVRLGGRSLQSSPTLSWISRLAFAGLVWLLLVTL